MNILNATQKMIAEFAHDEEGAQVVEYGMIIGAVSITLVVALKALNGVGFSGLVTRITNCLSGATACTAT